MDARALELYEAEKLPGLTQLIDRRAGLFRDRTGHGNEYSANGGALLWLHVLYGADLSAYEHPVNARCDLRPLTKRIYENDPYCRFAVPSGKPMITKPETTTAPRKQSSVENALDEALGR